MRRLTTGTLRHVLVGILVTMALMLQPAAVVAAEGVSDPGNPPTTDQSELRLKRVWLRQQRAMNRLGFMFDHAQQRLNDAQERIDAAEAQGKDVASLQTALDAFSEAIQQARPDYESAKGILQSHKGFDQSGNVTDVALATATIEQMAGKLEAVRESLRQPGRDLLDAFRAFRASNRPSSQ